MYITQSLKRAVQVNGNGIATMDGPRRHTWQAFALRVAQLAGALRTLGLSEGGRVAILALNSDRYLELYYAIPWAGGVIVPLNVRLAPPELSFMLNDSSAEILIVDDNFSAMLPLVQDQLETVRQVIYAGDGPAPAGTHAYERLVEMTTPTPDAERGGNDLAGIFYTGGTTGLPKGVMLTHDNLVSNALNFTIGLQFNEKSVHLHVAPMFHLLDSASSIPITMMAGVHAFVPKFTAAATLAAIPAYRVTNLSLAPTMINLLTNDPDVANYDLKSVVRIAYGGSPMPEAVLTKAKAVFANALLTQAYGMTELSPTVTVLQNEYHTFSGPFAGKTQSAGQPASTVEVKIVDLADNEVPHGVTGEIVVRGPNVMAGYWKRPRETEQALRNGWMHTGDAGYMDKDGFVFIVDRYKDMIISGGENVYSTEVENAIYQHPAVAMCAVIGIPSEQWGEAVHAIIIPKPGQTLHETEILDHCRTQIASYKCPRSVEVRQEPLPMSGAGKILKAQLRAPFWVGKTRQVN